jgi:hypothetical protein
MKADVSEHSTNFCWVFLLGRWLPATYCRIYYGFKRMKDEEGLLIQQNLIMNAAGIEPVTLK